VVVERRIDLVEHADRRRVGQEDTAKISAMAVSACSPPESNVMVCGFLPGGRATISRPASSGSSDSIELQFRGTATEEMREQPLEMIVDDTSNATRRRSRPSLD
jgi:hypothetical protein